MAVLMSSPLNSTIEGLNFDDDARNNDGSASFPPDSSGAAGPSHVVNATNASIQWFTKAGVQQAHTSLNNFFQALNPGPFLFDPKVTYDQYNGRFVVVALDVLDTSFGDPVNASRILIGVSDDSDPNGSWHYQAINSLLTINNVAQWLDYPGLAVDDSAIYITGNMFPFGAGTTAPGGSRLWIMEKGLTTGGLYAGGVSTANVYNPAGTSAASTGFTLQPAQTFGNRPVFGNTSNQVGTWLVAYNGGSGGTSETLMTIRVDSPLNNPTFDIQQVALGDIDNANNLGILPAVLAPSTPDAPQQGTATLIETNDRRTLNAVWRDNALWTVFQVVPNSGADNGQTTVHWVKISTANPGSLVVADQGDIGAEEIGGTVYTYMPSIAVDKFGNATVGFSASGPQLYAGAYYATRLATDPAGTFRTPRAVAAGLDSYVRTGGGTDNRWGDYSATVLDPSDEVSFWVYNQYAIPRATGTGTDLGRWGTRWGSLNIAALPGGSGGGGSGGGGGGGTTSTGRVTGTKWSDLDSDGIRDTNELGVAGFTIYLDIDGDNQIDIGEPSALTAADGTYTLTSSTFGTFAVREVPLSGWVQTFPGQAASFEHVVTLTSGGTVSGIDFGNNGTAFDFGDAPAPYPTTLAQNGARHAVSLGLHLGPPTVGATGTTTGVEPDTEADGTPDANALGDDLGGVDDEDGVTFAANSLIAGQNASIPVIISTGGKPTARLQAWIDFNGDGDWNDAGEQIVKNRSLGEGLHTITFAVPANATREPTFARFRYGYELDLGPTGVSIAGEVEDYRVQILTDEPQATDDAFSVQQNSLNNIFTVLANDFPSSNGSLQIDTVVSPTANGGTVTIGDNGTPTNRADDVLLYSPLNGFTGTDTFTYLISDGTGKSDTATVTVTVVSILNDPIAVDDSMTIPANSAGQVASATLNVLENDVQGNRPPILISAVTQPPSGQGTVSITAGSSRLLYTPPTSTFAGDVQFSYTIVDSTSPTPRTSTARVTLHVGNSAADDVVQVRVQPYDLNGNPISVINPGQEFELRGIVRDLRTDDTVGAPTDQLGVYAAYFDVLYESNLVSLTGPVVFNGEAGNPSRPWTSGQSVSTTTPGLLNEIGAFQGSTPLFTSNSVLLFTAPMRANATGEATFWTDPADVLPLRDILVYSPPTPAVNFSQVSYGATSLFIGDPADVLFAAVDDTRTASATTPTSLPVMANDLQGLDQPVTIISTTPIGSFQGTLQISGQNVVYTPPVGFAGGTQQFQYTIRNAAGATDTATVTLQIGPNTAANDTVQIRLVATNSSGTPISTVNVDETFQVRGFVDDLRDDDGDGNPATDRRGVAAAYFDLLYSYQVASVVPSASNPLGFEITFNNEYLNGKSGDAQIPGIIDELGAFQTNSAPLGASERPFFVMTFRAEAAGTFSYLPDPSDELPVHAVLTYEPVTAVPVALQRLITGAPVTIVDPGAGGEGEFTNPNNNLDVNDDGYVSAIDALLIINDMNSNGPRPLTAGAEGESGSFTGFVDVNGDYYLSAIDALLVINFLNAQVGGEGEGADETLDAPVDAPVYDADEAATTFAVQSFAFDPAWTSDDAQASEDGAELLLFKSDDELSEEAWWSVPTDVVLEADEDDGFESIDELFEEFGAEPEVLEGVDPRMIAYNFRGDGPRDPEAVRRRREGGRDYFDEIAAERLRRG